MIMPSYSIYVLFLLFSIQYFGSTSAYETLVKNMFPNGLPIDVEDDDAWHAYKLDDQKLDSMMMMDASVGTTIKPCIPKVRCGFKVFDDEETLRLEGDHHHPFYPYCKCPDGQKCMEAGVNADSHYIYYKCFTHDEASTEGLVETTSLSVETTNSEATVEPQTETPNSTELVSETTIELQTEIPLSKETDSEATVALQTEITSPVETGSQAAVELQSEMPTDSQATVELQSEMPTDSQATVELQSEMPTDSQATVELQSEMPTDSQATVELQSEIPTDSQATVELQTEVSTSVETVPKSKCYETVKLHEVIGYYIDRDGKYPEATSDPEDEMATVVEGMGNLESITVSQADSANKCGLDRIEL